MHSEFVVRKSFLIALVKLGFMACITAFSGWVARDMGLAKSVPSTVAVCTFVAVICTTLFYWTHRVAVAFLGVAVLIGSRSMTLQGLLRSTELDIIFFLIGMMVIVGALKDLGVLTWAIQSVINQKRMTGTTFTLILCGFSALLSSLIGEISSIVIVLALVFQVCDTLKVRAAPFVLISVICTNIGSTATMLGNPLGIFIGHKAGFTFNQFMFGAMPITLASFAATVIVLLLWYRKSIAVMTQQMAEHRRLNQGLGPLVHIPRPRSLFALAVALLIIAFQYPIEVVLGINGDENTSAFLIITPLLIAGLLMLYRPQRARYYVEHEVAWWTLLFFMLLFAIAGGLQEQGVTRNIADKLASLANDGHHALVPLVLGITSISSAFVNNIVFVAAFCPVIQSLLERSPDYSILWWALLFGACFGGNITVVGSTANIVALGLLEKHGHAHISFLEWLKLGLVVGVLTGAIAWGMLNILDMPSPPSCAHDVPTANVPLHTLPSLSPRPAQ